MDGDFTFSSITFPATRGAVAYQGDAAFCAARTYLEGVYYPIPFTSITPATGVAFAWRE